MERLYDYFAVWCHNGISGAVLKERRYLLYPPINEDPKLREFNGRIKWNRNFKKFVNPFSSLKRSTRKRSYDISIITSNNYISAKRLISVREISTLTFVMGTYYFLDLGIIGYFVCIQTADRFSFLSFL